MHFERDIDSGLGVQRERERVMGLEKKRQVMKGLEVQRERERERDYYLVVMFLYRWIYRKINREIE